MRVANTGRGVLRRSGAAAQDDASPERLEAWPGSFDDLPPFCGAVQAPGVQVIIVGVAHRDGGVSGLAARQVIEKFDPDLCLVELDRLRFSRLIAARRGLPWPYAPVRRGASEASLEQTVRGALGTSLDVASRASSSGFFEDDEEGGDEFFQAFEAAELQSAFCFPGDMPVSSAFDAFQGAVSRGLADPGQLWKGVRASFRAVGGPVSRQECIRGSTGSMGVSFLAAILADGGARSGPFMRSGALGLILGLLVSLVLGSEDVTQQENIPGWMLDATDFAITTIGAIFVIVGLSAWALSFLQQRDEHMVGQLVSGIQLLERMRSPISVPAQDLPMWCRWVKWSWAAFAPPPTEYGTQELSIEMIARARSASSTVSSDRGSTGSGILPRRFRLWPCVLPVCPLPASLPTEWNLGFDGGQQEAWLPVFTVKRPLVDGATRCLSLFEPRFLALIDDLVARGASAPGLTVAVVHISHGSERPLRLRGEEEGGSELQPPLAVEVDALLDAHVRIAEVEHLCEAVGEDGQRRWRMEIRGTSRQLPIRRLSLSCDPRGALWAAPGNNELAGEELASSIADSTCSGGVSSCGGGDEAPATIRVVAVVGLLHVNGIARRMQLALQDFPSR